MSSDGAGAAPKPDDGPEAQSEGNGIAAPLALWAFAFLFLRLFAVSGYDWDTAFLVSTTLRVSDGLSLLFGSFMAGRLIGAPLLVFLLPLLIAAYLWSPRGRRATVLVVAALASVTVVSLTISFNSWWLPVAASAVFGVLMLVRRLPSEGFLPRALTALIGRIGWVVGVATLVVALLTQTPWVPRERIETTDGTVTGYVLSVDSGYLNVLTEDHEFVILISGDVLSRG